MAYQKKVENGVAVLVYLIACGLMYWTAKVDYGGAVHLGGFFSTLVLLPIVHVMMGNLEKTKEPKPVSKATKVFGWCLLALVVALLIGLIVEAPGEMYSWVLGVELIGVVVCEGYRYLRKRQGKPMQQQDYSKTVSEVYSLLIIGTILFSLFAPTAKVSEAVKMLETTGYEDVDYACHANRAMYALAAWEATSVAMPQPSDWADMGLYLFDATKDGKRVGVFVEVYGGELVGAFPVGENSSLEFYLN